MNNMITTSNQTAMMSSREIAELTGKNHADVCRDVRTMLSALYGGEDKDYIRKADLLYLTNQGVDWLNEMLIKAEIISITPEVKS